jgi:hypothetical protein
VQPQADAVIARFGSGLDIIECVVGASRILFMADGLDFTR